MAHSTGGEGGWQVQARGPSAPPDGGERRAGRLTLPVASERSARPGTGAELIESGSAALWVRGGANEALMGWGGREGGE